DELPLDEIEQAPVPSGRPCQRFGERRRAVGGGRRSEPVDRRHDLRLPAAGSAALAERASRPRASVRPEARSAAGLPRNPAPFDPLRGTGLPTDSFCLPRELAQATLAVG